MKKIWFIVILSTITLGVLSFFIFQDKVSEIYTSSFDETETLILGSFVVKDLSINDSETGSVPLTTFSFKDEADEEGFLNYVFALDSFIGEAEYLYPNAFDYVFYLFLSGDYQYILYKDKINRYVFQPFYAMYEYSGMDTGAQYRFVCPLFMYFNNSEYSSKEHDLSYDQFIGFYESVNSDWVEINFDQGTVRIKAYDVETKEITSDYVIEITYSQDYLTTTYIGDLDE